MPSVEDVATVVANVIVYGVAAAIITVVAVSTGSIPWSHFVAVLMVAFSFTVFATSAAPALLLFLPGVTISHIPALFITTFPFKDHAHLKVLANQVLEGIIEITDFIIPYAQILRVIVVGLFSRLVSFVYMMYTLDYAGYLGDIITKSQEVYTIIHQAASSMIIAITLLENGIAATMGNEIAKTVICLYYATMVLVTYSMLYALIMIFLGIWKGLKFLVLRTHLLMLLSLRMLY